ncbi:hypothetical protein [Anaerotardibacter muris]|uniref:hypothetical protein n=1 Tax=Anaerotardibacter muris TaxID=2941505 RepID=UPI00203D7EDE|nr:hypothetical protein [Anaerotardibacter muris]
MSSEANRKTNKQEFAPIPKYQRTWITPQIIQRKIETNSALDYVMDNLDSIYAIDLSFPVKGLSLPEVYIKQLEASCPFCDKGTNQILARSQWLHLLERTNKSVEKISAIVDIDLERERRYLVDIEDIVMNMLNDQLFNLPNGAQFVLDREIENQDRFYINEKDLEAFTPNQIRIHLSGSPQQNISICSHPNIAGTYQCSNCGKPFGVALFNEIGNDPLDNETLIKGAIEKCSNKKRTKGPQPVEINKDSIVLRINDTAHDHTIELQTKTGLTKIDGVRFDAGNDVLTELLNCISVSQIFNDSQVVRSVMSKLPPLPSEVTRWAGCHNLKLLILANRFVEYPATFYETLLTDSIFFEIIDLQSGIPRLYSDIEAAYDMTGLPKKKSLRRSLFKNPLLLFKLLRADDLPFRNVDNINKLLANPNLDKILKSLGLYNDYFWEKGKCLAGWNELIKIKGENNVFSLLKSSSLNAIQRITDCFRQYCLIDSTEAKEEIANTRMRDLPKILPIILWIENNPHDNIDKECLYSKEQRNLETVIDDFSFCLPRCPRDYILAGIELHNCMGRIATIHSQVPHRTYILIKRDRKFVGGVMIEDMRVIKEAYAKCNDPLDQEKGLKEACIKWGEINNLTFEAFAV